MVYFDYNFFLLVIIYQHCRYHLCEVLIFPAFLSLLLLAWLRNAQNGEDHLHSLGIEYHNMVKRKNNIEQLFFKDAPDMS